jgi:hypothetical protein
MTNDERKMMSEHEYYNAMCVRTLAYEALWYLYFIYLLHFIGMICTAWRLARINRNNHILQVSFYNPTTDKAEEYLLALSVWTFGIPSVHPSVCLFGKTSNDLWNLFRQWLWLKTREKKTTKTVDLSGLFTGRKRLIAPKCCYPIFYSAYN